MGDLEALAKIVIALLLAVGAGAGGRELISRARSGTKRMLAENDDQVSVLEERRAERVQWVVREATFLKQIEDLKDQLANAQTKLTVVAMLSASDPESSAQVAVDSAFIDTHRPLRPTPKPKPKPQISPHDPFQAADPFAPPPKRK